MTLKNGSVFDGYGFKFTVGGALSRKGRGEESDGIMFFIQKFAFARKRVLRNACLRFACA